MNAIKNIMLLVIGSAFGIITPFTIAAYCALLLEDDEATIGQVARHLIEQPVTICLVVVWSGIVITVIASDVFKTVK